MFGFSIERITPIRTDYGFIVWRYIMKKSSFVIDKSKMTFTKKGIKIQSPKVVIKGDLIKTDNISAKDIDSTKLKTDFC